jgi:uncharacterized membrane protein YkgB
MNIRIFDKELIHFFRRVSMPLARIGLFVIFFWFGLLKVIGLSPATALVQDLFVNTIPFMPFPTFLILFGLFEMLIGVLFLISGLERLAIPLLFIHMITTLMPLVLIPQETWSAMFVPTLEGQYIIKNLALIATAVGIASHLHPLPRR